MKFLVNDLVTRQCSGRPTRLCCWILSGVLIWSGFISTAVWGQTTYQWQPGSNDWHQSSSWSPGGGPPTVNDIALFDEGTIGTDTIDWDDLTGNQTVDQLMVTKGDYLFQNNGSQEYKLGINSGNDDALLVSGGLTVLSVEGLIVVLNSGGVLVDDGATLNLDVGNGFQTQLSTSTGIVNNGTINNFGGVMQSDYGRIGYGASDVGVTNIDGNNSRWLSSGFVVNGWHGTGTLNISNQGYARSRGFALGYANGQGTVNVSGSGSEWDTRGSGSPGIMHVGYFGDGFVNVLDGATALTDVLAIAQETSSTGNVLIDDATMTSEMATQVGLFGDATLTIQNGGILNSDSAAIAMRASSESMAEVTGGGSQWNITNDLFLGGDATVSGGNGSLSVLDSGMVSVGGETTILDNGKLTIDGGTLITHGLDNSGSGLLDFADGTLEVTGAGNRFIDTQFRIDGQTSSDRPHLIISDDATSGTRFNVGVVRHGTLTIEQSAEVNGLVSYVGEEAGSTGIVNVRDPGSSWVTAALRVGNRGNGTLNISDGGVVFATNNMFVGADPGSQGTVNVSGGSARLSVDLLTVGNSTGNGLIRIGTDGIVAAEETRIGVNGEIQVNGGHLDFGTMDIAEFHRVQVNSGSVAGNFDHSGFSHLDSFSPLQNSAGDLTGITVTNSGTLYGSFTNLGNSLTNTSTGTLLTQSGEVAQFRGSVVNAGEINNLGGILQFDQTITNQGAGFNTNAGFIGGRGTFGANEGWTNAGVMAFSGDADLFGDVEVLFSGQVITSGNATTTFFDDVIHNGDEIRTSAGSSTVFFGEFTGAGAFTGTGDVFFEGDLRPGNSPGVLFFEGDVALGETALTEIEFSGTAYGEYDRLSVDGDLAIDGQLSIAMIDGFQLQFGDEFLIADVGGLQTGFFNGLGEGALVGRFSGVDLFITYQGGNGNDVSLFTAVPEPGSLALLAGLSGWMLTRRRRQS